MATYSDVVTDDQGYGRPIPGVAVYVYNQDGSLTSLIGTSNPVLTNELGQYSITVADPGAVVNLEYRYAGVTKRLDSVIIGKPAQYVGDTGATGPANSTYTSLASLKAAPVTNASYIFAPPGGTEGSTTAGTFLYQTAGAPYTADGVNIIKLDAVPLTTGALVRQGARGIATSQPIAGTSAAILDAQTVGSRRFDARDYNDFQINTSNDMGPVLTRGSADAATAKTPLNLPGGTINIGTPFTPQFYSQLIGSGAQLTVLQNDPDSNTPVMQVTAATPQTHMRFADFSVRGNNLTGEHGFVFQDDFWYSTLENIQFDNFGGKALWLRGGIGNGSDRPLQFVTLRDIKIFRPNRSDSRSLSLTGKCGQIYFEGHCEFDGNVSGGFYSDGCNVAISREFYNSSTGQYGDIFDALDTNTFGLKPNWGPTPLTAGGVTDESCYLIDFKASVQGSVFGLMLDRGDLNLTTSYFEGLKRSITALNNGTIWDKLNKYRNAGSLPTSDGNGYIGNAANNGRIMFGENTIEGDTNNLYVSTTGSGFLTEVAPSIIATTPRADLLGSQTSKNLAVGTVTLPDGSTIANAIDIGTLTDVFVNAGDPVDLKNIVSLASPGTRLLLKCYEPSGANKVLRLVPGGNIYARDFDIPQFIIMRHGDSIEITRTSVFGVWVITARSIAQLTSPAMPGSGYYEQGEIVTNTGTAAYTPDANGKLLVDFVKKSTGYDNSAGNWQSRYLSATTP